MSTMDASSIAVYLAIGIPTLLFLHSYFSAHSLRDLPTVGGPSAPLLSYIGAFSWVHHARTILQEGYDKYKGGIFKVPMLDRWLVVVTGSKLVDELQKFPDDHVSFFEAVMDLINMKYIFGPQIRQNPYHVTVIREKLTKHLTSTFPDIRDEIVTVFSEFIPATTDDWVAVPAMVTMRQIVARISNRVFVGLPYSRNPDYLNLAINFTVDVGKARNFLSLFPPILKPLAAKAVTDIDRRVTTCLTFLVDLVNERLEAMKLHGDGWTDKPNDMLQWLIEEEMKTPGGFDIRNLMQMILMVNFAAIHTSSNSFTHALYHLAANPEFILPLREEVEAVVQTDGWTKLAMGKMRKLDSFMRESQRVNGINSISVTRKALQDLKFANGVVIPAGTVLVAPATATHLDEDNYTNADIFDPWRFSGMRQEDGESLKHQFVSTSVEYVPFGHGKHACPGRFFAANELKAMMAHLVLNYDVKFEEEGVRPPNQWFGLTFVPDPTAKVLFRKRRD